MNKRFELYFYWRCHHYILITDHIRSATEIFCTANSRRDWCYNWNICRTSHCWLHIFFINQQKKIPQQQGSWQMKYCESAVGYNLRISIINYVNRSLQRCRESLISVKLAMLEALEIRLNFSRISRGVGSRSEKFCSWLLSIKLE